MSDKDPDDDPDLDLGNLAARAQDLDDEELDDITGGFFVKGQGRQRKSEQKIKPPGKPATVPSYGPRGSAKPKPKSFSFRRGRKAKRPVR